MPKPLHELQLDTMLSKSFSFQALNTAQALGMLDMLAQYAKLKAEFKAQPRIELKIAMLEKSAQLHQKIQQASLEVASLASELDCEEERADQIAAYLRDKENEFESRLTASAIIVGALGAVSSGILITSGKQGNQVEYIGIGTGLIEAVLGAIILKNTKKAHFYHPRNVLSDIWYGPAVSNFFPPSVWYYLNYENPQTNTPSIRKQIVELWVKYGQLAYKKQKDLDRFHKLLFGKGGIYTADELTSRANMFDQLESQINLMKQDLKHLSLALERWINE